MIQGVYHQISLQGKRILYLTKNPRLIEKQLAGEDLKHIKKNQLLDQVSTEAYPTRACFRFDLPYMAKQALTGIKLGHHYIPPGAIQKGNFKILVAGHSFGCGSSREHFPWSLKLAGIELLIVRSIERIFAENCQNIGLYYLVGDPSRYIKRLVNGQGISIHEITKSLNTLSATIVQNGGLFNFFKHQTQSVFPLPKTNKRAMTASEKIIAKHFKVPYVKPGDSGFINVDHRYTYEIFAPFSFQLANNQLSQRPINNPSSIYCFYDHSVLDKAKTAKKLAKQMKEVACQKNLLLYDGNSRKGAKGICHIIMLEEKILPGEVAVGTDSHTCTLGAIGSFAFGVGATEWAVSLFTRKARLTVPKSIKINLLNKPAEWVMAKDIMLYLLSLPAIKHGGNIGKIFHFQGEALDILPFDEQVVLANMSVEGGAFTGFVELNLQTINYLKINRRLSEKDIKARLVFSDDIAKYDEKIDIDLSQLTPFIASPGDPRNGHPIKQLSQSQKPPIKINTAFIGSCTGGKYYDLFMAAKMLRNRQVHKNVELFISPASQAIYLQAKASGLIDIFQKAGAIILPPACGACVNFGPGSVHKGKVGISTTNRNFPGRMGQGEVWLANPAVVSASAITGQITNPILIS